MEHVTVDENGAWPCEHEGGHTIQLNEKDAMLTPPHYVICPDCGTHWIVWLRGKQKMAAAVIVPIAA